MAAGLGDIIFCFTSVLWKRLKGNTTTTPKYLTSIGTGSAATAPTWRQPTEADLALTDITTNDVSTSKHGLVPKLPNDSTKFLNGVGAFAVPAGSGAGTVTHTGLLTAGNVVVGNGTDDITVLASPGTSTQVLHGGSPGVFAAVVEADLSLSDVTTGNVSTSRHGLVPKAPNDASQFLDGTGAFSTPSGGGSGDIYVVKTADEIVTGSITFQDDDHLVIPVTTNSVYWFDLRLLLQTTVATTDWKIKWTVPASVTMAWGINNQQGAAFQFDPVTTGGTPQPAFTEGTQLNFGASATGLSMAEAKGWIFTGATAGNVVLQWAQFTSGASNNTFKRGAFVKYKKLI